MQEPEIFEQPVVTRDPETHPIGDDHGTNGGTIYSKGVATFEVADDDESDYRDFVYPEGWCLVPFPP